MHIEFPGTGLFFICIVVLAARHFLGARYYIALDWA